MHLKNFSLIENQPGSRQFVLTAAYDLLPVNIILPEDTEETAFTLNGKKRNLHKSDFLKFAASCSIPEKAARNMISKITRLQDLYITMCRESFLAPDLQEQFCTMIQERIHTLG